MTCLLVATERRHMRCQKLNAARYLCMSRDSAETKGIHFDLKFIYMCVVCECVCVCVGNGQEFVHSVYRMRQTIPFHSIVHIAKCIYSQNWLNDSQLGSLIPRQIDDYQINEYEYEYVLCMHVIMHIRFVYLLDVGALMYDILVRLPQCIGCYLCLSVMFSSFWLRTIVWLRGADGKKLVSGETSLDKNNVSWLGRV